MAVDAPWGTGKTTFLRMWKQHLHNCGFSVVEFNAWETDFSEDPLVALTAEITKGLEEQLPPNSGIDVSNLRKQAGKILLAVGSNAIRLATQGVVDPATIKANGEEESSAELRMKTHLGIQQYIRDFKDSLQRAASTVRETNEGRPLVVVIDELDRCRPPYAIELLEMAKHLFAVDNIIFILATNRSALAHSVKVVYGSELDADGYLRRFFDIDFRLPKPKRENFVRAMLNASQITDYLEVFSNEDGVMHSLLVGSLNSSHLSLRDIAQAIHRFVLVFGSLPRQQRPLLSMATLALVLRAIDTELYYRFIEGTATDTEVAERLSSILGYDSRFRAA